MKSRKFGFVLSVFSVLGAAPAGACNLVYGSDWAFASEAPEHWNSACSDEAMEGTSITLWPAEESQSTATALIYVTVNEKGSNGLAAFVVDEQSTFKDSSPNSTVSAVQSSQNFKYEHLMARYHNPSQGREELVAYVAGPTAYFMIVLSANSDSALAVHRSAFLSYVQNFVPMSRK